MDEICSLCNGLHEINKICKNCGQPMDDIGRLEDYSGPYSPYMGKETFSYNNKIAFTGDNCCIHLYECPTCKVLEHEPVPLISL